MEQLGSEKTHLEAALVVPLLQSAAGITTRSKAKLTPDQWTEMPLPGKMVALLADALIEIQEQVQVGDGEESEWEEIQEGDVESDKNLMFSTAGTSFGRTTYDQLEAMAKAFNEDEENGDDDGLLHVADPLNEINLASYLADFFGQFFQSDRKLFDHLCQGLTQAQQDAIRSVLER